MAKGTGLPVREIPSLLSLLALLGFCQYEASKEQVCVPLLAWLYQQLLPQKSRLSCPFAQHRQAAYLTEEAGLSEDFAR